MLIPISVAFGGGSLLNWGLNWGLSSCRRSGPARNCSPLLRSSSVRPFTRNNDVNSALRASPVPGRPLFCVAKNESTRLALIELFSRKVTQNNKCGKFIDAVLLSTSLPKHLSALSFYFSISLLASVASGSGARLSFLRLGILSFANNRNPDFPQIWKSRNPDFPVAESGSSERLLALSAFPFFRLLVLIAESPPSLCQVSPRTPSIIRNLELRVKGSAVPGGALSVLYCDDPSPAAAIRGFFPGRASLPLPGSS